MSKLVVIGLLAIGAYFFWERRQETGRVQICWIAGQKAGYTGNLQFRDYDGSEKASAEGIHVIMFLPHDWDPSDNASDGPKGYICGVDRANHVERTVLMVNGQASM